MKKLFIFLIGIIGVFLLNIPLALADGRCPPGEIETVFWCVSNLSQLMCKLFSFATYIGGAVGAVMIIYGGIRYITSSGNPQGIAEAKNIIFITLGALAVLILAQVIFSIIGVSWCT